MYKKNQRLAAGLLCSGDYPPSLKQRISSRFGHLDNQAAASLLGHLPADRLQHVVAAHLSRTNNTPDLARAALAAALGRGQDAIAVASQDDGFDWREIR